MSSNIAANTNHTIYFVDKSKCHKISPLHAFPLKFRVQDNFYVQLSNFDISKIPTHCLKKALVT